MKKFSMRVAGLLSLFFVFHSLYHIGYAHYYMYEASEKFVKREQTNEDIFLTMPKLGRTLPIVEGIDNDSLEKGIGHYKTTVLPNQKGTSILAGHRDTVFRHLDLLEIGDDLVIQTNNEATSYVITNRQIVTKAYRMPVVQQEKPVIVLITCYPMKYIGPAPNRLIITAEKKM
jgi:sortase A